ncbi:MAG: Fpg/Nei family DNA glycosylase [Intrasporangiaceae bacterium]|nr:Fpg/Nei family DNA glycosylase [Intrasporangiaceae bacterium]
MPEGDTVWRTCQRLDTVFRGQVLALAELRWGRLIDSDLTGMGTIEVVPRGKHILHRLDSGLTVHSHLKMEGSWRIQDATDRVPQQDRIRAVLGTDRWTALGSRLGRLDLVRTDDEATLVGHLGPDILGEDWDRDRAVANLRAGRLGSTHDLIAASLLDQRNLAGIGTMWASEGLWVERINPWRPVSELGDAQLSALLDRIKRLMTQACAKLPGESYVHARSGHPCRRCGQTIRVALAGPADRERTLFSCPRCQDGLAPTDDGKPQAPLSSGQSRSRSGYRRRT